jgi:transposase InsO family protein
MKFVCDQLRDGLTVVELSRKYGISRPTAYKWIKRYQEEGLEGLKDRSRAARHHPNAVDAERESLILKMREKHSRWGPEKIRARLQREFPGRAWPAPSTIGVILARHGLSVARQRRRRSTPSPQPLRQGERPNAVWCADFKGWFRSGDGKRCDPFTLLDHYSRYLLRCQLLPQTGITGVQALMEAAFREYGLPEVIRTDNGSPFASRGIGGLSRLSVWWLKLGIEPQRIMPGEPQQNGAQERFHRTVKEETAQPPAESWWAQQQRLNRFRQEYNQERPHQSLGQNTPDSFYEPSPRCYPQRLTPVEYPKGTEVRRVQVRGEFYWKQQAVFLGEAFQGEPVGLQLINGPYWQIHFVSYPLGIFDSSRCKVLSDAEVRRLRSSALGGDLFRSAPEISTDSHEQS